MPFVNALLMDWFYDYVLYIFTNGLFSGVSTTPFSPQSPMAHGMIVTVFGRLAKIDTTDYAGASFDDATLTQYYAPYIKWAVEQGIVITSLLQTLILAAKTHL